MTIESESLAAACAASREADGYPSSDQLLRDLQGHNGEGARSIATGYMMAIHDADADCLGAATLLRYLRGHAGESMCLAGTGYVMAVRDCMESARVKPDGNAVHAARSGVHADVERVKAWLERHPHDQLQLAISSVQLALVSPAVAPRRQGRQFRRSARWLKQRVVSSSLQATVIAGAVAVCGALLLAAWSSAQDRLRAGNVELTEQASNVTTLMLEQRRYEKDSFINISDRRTLDAYGQKWEQARASITGTFHRLDSLDLSDADRQAVLEMSRDFRVYADGYERLLSQMRNGQVATAQDANEQIEAYKSAAHRVETLGAELTARASNRLRT